MRRTIAVAIAVFSASSAHGDDLEPRPAAAAAPDRLRYSSGDAWSDPENPVRRVWGGERLDLWSLRQPEERDPPRVRNESWVQTPIDRFVLAALEAEGLEPSPEADRRTLVRRLYHDVTGLPPSPEEARAFEEDDLPGAYERLVEKLLHSPRHGEKWARHWLDAARYADTNGHERDEFRPNAYRYRDYVIRAFNEDKPFDTFIREQIAGDEMLEGAPRTGAEADRLIATGFLRAGLHDSTAPIFQEEAKARNELMADLVNTTGSAFLGLTFSCANCHDHKHDPILQADHFRFRAFFAAVKPLDDVPVEPAREAEAIERHNTEVEGRAAKLEAAAAELLAPAKARLEAARRSRLSEEEKTLLERGRDDLEGEAKAKLEAVRKKLQVPEGDAVKELGEAERKRLDDLRGGIAQVRAGRREHCYSPVMTDAGADAPPTRIFSQGDFTQEREEVEPGFLIAFDPAPAEIRHPRRAGSTGRRTALADWIAARENPFTGRVIVNRIWLRYLGAPLFANPNDLGHASPPPPNPALLDWLAIELAERGWSLRRIHRLILLSATYRQASRDRPEGREKDPENRLLWRQNVRRLEAEAIRDAMLSVSGRLLPRTSGPPLWPPVPEDILHAQPAILEVKSDDEAKKRLQGYRADPEEACDVRTIFLVQKRSVPLPFLQTFDLPETSTSCARRDVTTVAPQALSLLNSGLTERMSAAFAERVEAEAGEGPRERVERAVRLALSRPPGPVELAASLRLLEEHERLHALEGAADPSASALTDLCRALFNVNEFVYVD